MRARAVFIIGAGVISISYASILIKLCAASPLVIAFYRLAIAALFYLAIARRRVCTRPGPDTAWILLSGLFLALHFAAWITSLDYTTVASSVVLVQTSPVFVALGGALFLRERTPAVKILGVLLAVAGSLNFGLVELADRALGNLLALCGALAAAGYFVVGRKMRAHMGTVAYVSRVYSAAAVILLPFVLAEGSALFDHDLRTYILLAAIAVLPQIVGHTSLNWALKYYSATAVAVFTLGESVGASALAWLILAEPLSLKVVLGAMMVLGGVILVLLGEKREYPQRTNVV